MKYIWAVAACSGLFCLYVFLGLVVFGWDASHQPFGGVFPQLILLAAMVAAWRAITKGKKSIAFAEGGENKKGVSDKNIGNQLCPVPHFSIKNIHLDKTVLVGLAIALTFIFLIVGISAIIKKTGWQEVRVPLYVSEVLYLNYETLGGRSGVEKGLCAIRYRDKTLKLYKTKSYEHNYKSEKPDKILEGVASFQIERIDAKRYGLELAVEMLKENSEFYGRQLGQAQSEVGQYTSASAENKGSGKYNWKTRKDFIESVREKYPIYDGCSDHDLYQHLTKLFPEYIGQIEENFK